MLFRTAHASKPARGGAALAFRSTGAAALHCAAALVCAAAACTDQPATGAGSTAPAATPAAPARNVAPDGAAAPAAAAPAANAATIAAKAVPPKKPAAPADAPPLRKLVPFHYATGTLVGYRDADTGVVVLPPRYQQARPFSAAGVAYVWETEWRLIDQLGVVLLTPLEVDNGPDDASEGVARFRRGGKVGFFDERGKAVIPAVFDWAEPFHEGRAAFCDGCRTVPDGEHKRLEGGRWGYLDHGGKRVVPARFDSAGPFEGGLASVVQAGRRFSVRPDGTEAPSADTGR